MTALTHKALTHKALTHKENDLHNRLIVAEFNLQQVEAELLRLHQCCRDVYEVWAGSEGIPEPQTAAEAYLLSLVEQMRDVAKEGLK